MLAHRVHGGWLAPITLSLWCSTLGCIDTRTDSAPASTPTREEEAVPPVVAVDFGLERVTVPPHAYGLHSSVYDNALHEPSVPGLLHEAGVALLRWPGGGYSDNYHWSNHSMTPFSDGQVGYLAEGSDFGSYVSLIEAAEVAMMITVNYGSNLSGTGPGEPKEAAAWVAYANGDPDDTTLIGVDGSGEDWQTVGYWASLRASSALGEDDGKNFLRIEHPEPLGVRYWEVGNEVFGNGYHERDGVGYELDLHVPYDGTPRAGNAALSGTTYGSGVVAYIEAMKAVDPGIEIGAVLNTPPADYQWGPKWNEQVLSECGSVIDFAVVHWYPPFDARGLLNAPQTTIKTMVEELRGSFELYAPDNAANIELAMTELGPGVNASLTRAQSQVRGLFAADAYVTSLEHGFFNVDWLELHNGSFLSERTQSKGPAFNGIQMAHLLAAPGDVLVSTTSNTATLIAHAARRADGGAALMLINAAPPVEGALPASVSVDVTGLELSSDAERFDYAPSTAAENGSVVGPSPVSAVGNAFVADVAPYSAVVLVFATPE
jgi:hypothetical protein